MSIRKYFLVVLCVSVLSSCQMLSTGSPAAYSDNAKAIVAFGVEKAEPIDKGFFNAKAIVAFGVEKAEPIDKGFFFRGGKYIEAPYVVERRGLDILINGVLVRRGPEYPPFILDGEQDPGDPPAGSSPFDRPQDGTDRRDTYWERKWAYLKKHKPMPEAFAEMMATYRKSTKLTSVEKHPEYGSMVNVVTESGKRVTIDLTPAMGEGPVSKEEYLRGARRSMDHYRRKLGGGGLFFVVHGGEMSVPSPRMIDILDVLASDADGEAKMQMLVEKRFVKPNDQSFSVIATGSEVSQQLLDRLAVLKAKTSAARR